MSTWKSILPYLQVSLGVWQILKFTPLVGIIQGVIGWLLWPLFPGFFPCYALLRRFPGRVFKKVKCVVLTKAEPLTRAPEILFPQYHHPISPPMPYLPERVESLESMWYLGEEFSVSKKGNKLFVNGEMSHYISDVQWKRIEEMEAKCFKKERENKVVFVIGYTGFWEEKVSGNVMTFEEVLDRVVFDETGVMIPSDVDVGFLPVDLSDQSKAIISKLLNLVGLFFQAKQNKFSWYYPTIFSAASAVLQFPPVNAWIYVKTNKVFCWSVQCICDQLPYSVRRLVYSVGFWVGNLRPCNDIQLKAVKGNIDIVIGGAAKINGTTTSATRMDWLTIPEKELYKEFGRGRPTFITAKYNEKENKCDAIMTYNNEAAKTVVVNCPGQLEFQKICTFLSCVADTESGSLKYYDEKKKKVVVRRWRESVRHYVDAGFPTVYTLSLKDVIVRGNF